MRRGRGDRARCARGAAAAVAAALLAGCPRVPPPDLSRDPAQLAAQVRAAQGRVTSVRGSARVSIASPGLSGTLQELAAAARPDRVRLETLDFFGNPAALLVASGGRFAFLDGRAGVLYRGDATPENVSRLLPVVMPVEELVTILCGSAPLLPGRPLEAVPRDNLVLLTIAGDGLTQQLGIGEAATVAWSKVRRGAPAAGGAVRDAPAGYDLEFHVFDRRAGVLFPAEAKLDAAAAGARIDFEWKDDLEVNGELEASLFELAPRGGVRVVDLAPGQGIPAPDLPLRPPRE